MCVCVCSWNVYLLMPTPIILYSYYIWFISLNSFLFVCKISLFLSLEDYAVPERRFRPRVSTGNEVFCRHSVS